MKVMQIFHTIHQKIKETGESASVIFILLSNLTESADHPHHNDCTDGLGLTLKTQLKCII